MTATRISTPCDLPWFNSKSGIRFEVDLGKVGWIVLQRRKGGTHEVKKMIFSNKQKIAQMQFKKRTGNSECISQRKSKFPTSKVRHFIRAGKQSSQKDVWGEAEDFASGCQRAGRNRVLRVACNTAQRSETLPATSELVTGWFSERSSERCCYSEAVDQLSWAESWGSRYGALTLTLSVPWGHLQLARLPPIRIMRPFYNMTSTTHRVGLHVIREELRLFPPLGFLEFHAMQSWAFGVIIQILLLM